MLRYLLRLGIRLALLFIGVLLVAGIYYSDGCILVDGWKWMQGLADAVVEVFFRYYYFLGIGALLVVSIYGLWRVGKFRRSGVRFVLSRQCVISDPYRHGLVVGSTGCGKTASVVEPYLREALRSGHAGAVTTTRLLLWSGVSTLRPRRCGLEPAG